MKNFTKKYKNFIDSVNLTDNDYNEIKKNILLEHNYNYGFKLKYAFILILLFISIIGVANADKIIKHYKIITNDNKTFEESNNRSFISNAVLDKDYPKNMFIKDSYYTYNEIEKKLGFKLLKNKCLDSNLFLVSYLETNENMISKISFNLVNEDKTKMNKPQFNIIIKTKYFSKENDGLNIKGGKVYYEEYYIKSLNTEAIIVKDSNEYANMVIIEFTYENIAYELQYGATNFANEEEIENLYNFLEAFTLNI